MLSSPEVARWGIRGDKTRDGRGSARPRTMGLQLQQGEDIRWGEEVEVDKGGLVFFCKGVSPDCQRR